MSVRVVPWKPEVDGPKRWRVDIRFRRPDGCKVRDQRVYEAPTKGMAQRWGQSRESQLRSGSLVLEKRKAPLFKTFVEGWMETYPASVGNGPHTVTEKETHLKHHLVPFFGEMTLDQIDKKTIQEFVAAFLKKTKGKPVKERKRRAGTGPKPLSPKTCRNVLMTLRKILVTANEWGDLAAVPKLPNIKVSQRDFDFYGAEDAEALIQAAGDAMERALLRFAIHTGARAGELLAIEWCSIDARRKLVTFSRSSTKGVLQDTTKSRKPRRVPLSPALEADLKAIRHLKSSLVFCDHEGKPLNLGDLHRVLRRAARKANLPCHRWHDLRHSYASILTIKGTPMRQVQEWMGHSTILMTARYSHLAPGGGREHMAAFDVPAAPAAPGPRHATG